MTIAARPPDPSWMSLSELVRCACCDAPLARRWASGGLKPLVEGSHLDERGRFVIVCPVCGTRVRFTVQRRG